MCKRFASPVECKIMRTDSLWLYFSSMLLGIPLELVFLTHSANGQPVKFLVITYLVDETNDLFYLMVLWLSKLRSEIMNKIAV